jgi:hypothetical protein
MRRDTILAVGRSKDGGGPAASAAAGRLGGWAAGRLGGARSTGVDDPRCCNDTDRPAWRIMTCADRTGWIELKIRPARPWLLRCMWVAAPRGSTDDVPRDGWSALSGVPARIAPVDDAHPAVTADDDRARPRLERPDRCTNLHVTLPFRAHRPRFALPSNRCDG